MSRAGGGTQDTSAGGRTGGQGDQPELATALLELSRTLRDLKERGQPEGHLTAAGSAYEFEMLSSQSKEYGRMGVVALERIQATVDERPELVTEVGEKFARKLLGANLGEAWNYDRLAKDVLIPMAEKHKTLARCIAMVCAALDKGRTLGAEQQHAFLHQVLKVMADGLETPSKDLSYGWPLLGIADPGGAPLSLMAPGERGALAAYHRDEMALAAARGKSSSSGDGHGGHDQDKLQQAINKAEGKAMRTGKQAGPPGGGAHEG